MRQRGLGGLEGRKTGQNVLCWKRIYFQSKIKKISETNKMKLVL